ncbi:nephrin-like isoform X2 [Stegodyphus dumicola]|uniref:nephrin-like isoform X2 n=1 Tax=Stegodyphus dumicola TaxID=202533 RepID=UPI0015A9D17E|nr:nephrin-like isoform X2 [Stegodyphus dumicola]
MSLPCDITSTMPDDEVYLVLWYKDEIATPIYSLDARRGKLGQARHASSEELTGRSFFSSVVHPAVLQVDKISLDDEGIYRCRVDFKKARTRHSALLVTVVVPPATPIIKDSNGEILSGIVGPYNEGDSLHLICETEGGKPSPSLVWYKGRKIIDDSYEMMSALIIRNELIIPKLQRKDLMATFTCQATNNEISPPVQSSITLDMNFKPVSVTVRGKRKRLSAGKIVQFECEARGSRPPALLTWRKGSMRLKSSVDKMSSQGNVSTSILTMTPSSEDHGKFISCQADNVMIPGSAIEDSWKLEVHYVPQLSLRLGSKLRHSNIMEGNDVYFECNIRANPWVSETGWRFEGHELVTNISAGVIVSNQSLVLQKVQRNNRGRYSCTATNSEGQGESNHVYLRVQYSPVCKQNQETTYGAMLHYPVQIPCEVEADPDDVAFRWEFNSSSGNLELVPTYTSGTKSLVNYIPRSESDFGTLQCWGRNSVGSQRVPCLFFVIPAEPPNPVHNCTVTEESENSFRIVCMEGKDGGLSQYFFMEIRDMASNVLQQNVSAQTADFTARALFPGSKYTVSIFASNARGRSRPVIIHASTAALPESQTRQDDDWQLTLHPMILILCGVVGGLLLVVLLVILVIKIHIMKRKRKDMASASANEKSAQNSEKSVDNCSEGCTCSGREEEKIRENIPDVVVFSEKMKPGEEESFVSYAGETVHWNRINPPATSEEYLTSQVKMKLPCTKGAWPQTAAEWPSQPVEAVALQFHRPADDSMNLDPRHTLPLHTLPTIEESPIVTSASSPTSVITKQPVMVAARQTDV